MLASSKTAVFNLRATSPRISGLTAADVRLAGEFGAAIAVTEFRHGSRKRDIVIAKDAGDNAAVVAGYGGSLNDWKKVGYDAGSLMADPHLSIDSTSVHLAADSPAFGLGFANLPLDQMSKYGIV